MDVKKVIKGLELCEIGSGDRCYETECPYYGQECTESLKNDILELLKDVGWNLLTEDQDGIIHGLPGNDGRYLMTDGKDIWIDDYVDGVTDGISLDSGSDIREIKAWTYMPELP